MELLIIVGLILVGVVLIIACILATWKKVPADKAAIVTGLGEPKVVTGKGTVVIPVLQRIDYITLENINFEVSMQGTFTSDAVPIEASGVVVVKIKRDEIMIRSAIEQFKCNSLEETKSHIESTSRDVCEGRLREIIADMTAEQLFKDRKTFSERVQEVAAKQLSELGLELKSFTIKGISDKNGYFEALSKPQIAAVKRDAEIAEAEANKESMIKTSEANRVGEQARLEAEAKNAESAKNAEVKKLEYFREQETRRAISDAAYAIQESVTKKEVTNASMDVDVLREQRAKEVKEAEIQVLISAEQKNTELAQKKAERKEKELLETQVKPAEAEKIAVELRAEADKVKAIKDAEAKAEAKKLDAFAEAENIKRKGEAEAEIIASKGKAEAEAIRQRGLAEAEAMEKKAEAYAKYGQAAITQMIVEQLPEFAKAISEPMSKIGNITIIGGGNNTSGGGADDITCMALKSLKAVTVGVSDIIGFDITDVMKANTYDAKVTNNLNVDVTGLDGTPSKNDVIDVVSAVVANEVENKMENK